MPSPMKSLIIFCKGIKKTSSERELCLYIVSILHFWTSVSSQPSWSYTKILKAWKAHLLLYLIAGISSTYSFPNAGLLACIPFWMVPSLIFPVCLFFSQLKRQAQKSFPFCQARAVASEIGPEDGAPGTSLKS